MYPSFPMGHNMWKKLHLLHFFYKPRYGEDSSQLNTTSNKKPVQGKETPPDQLLQCKYGQASSSGSCIFRFVICISVL